MEDGAPSLGNISFGAIFQVIADVKLSYVLKDAILKLRAVSI